MLKILIANLKVQFDGHLRCNNFSPDLMKDLTILGFMWIKDFLTMSNQRSFQEVPGGPIPGGHQSERPAVSSAR